MEDELLETFAFDETSDGQEHHYRVTAHDHQFAIERDGQFVAELQHNEEWQQIDGSPLPISVIESLGDKIERHFCWGKPRVVKFVN